MWDVYRTPFAFLANFFSQHSYLMRGHNAITTISPSNFIWRAKVEPALRPFMMNNFAVQMTRCRPASAKGAVPRQLVAVETKAVRSAAAAAAAVVFVLLHPIWVHNADAHPVRNLSRKYKRMEQCERRQVATGF